MTWAILAIGAWLAIWGLAEVLFMARNRWRLMPALFGDNKQREEAGNGD